MGRIDDWLDRWNSRATGPTAEYVPEQRRALTAAGSRVNLRKPAMEHTRRESWQQESFGYREKVPEMRFAGDFVGSTLGRLRVFPAENRPRGEEPVPLERSSKRAQAADELGVDQHTIDAAIAACERLNLNQHGASLLARAAENLEYCGECYLLGQTDEETGGETWSIRSVTELHVTQGGARLVDSDTGMQTENLPADECDLYRLWNPHPRWYNRPDAAVAALLDTLEGMYLLGKRGRAHDRSRISAGKGLFVPSELMMARPGGAPVSADIGGVFDDAEQHPMMSQLIEYMTAGIIDEGDPSAIVPLLFIGPATLSDGVKTTDVLGTFDLHGEDPQDLDARYEALVMRFARGINLAPERVKGLAESSTTWSANTVTAEEIKTSVEPRAERLCDALSAAYLQRTLKAMGVPPEQRRKITLWYDPSELVQNPNRAEDAKAAHTASAMSDAALLRHLGFTEDDLPDAPELLRRTLTTRELSDKAAPMLVQLLTEKRLPTRGEMERLMTPPVPPGERPVVDATPPRQNGKHAPQANPAARQQAKALDPTPPVGQRSQPATATQPGALGASGAPAGERQWRVDRRLGKRLTAIDRDLTTRLVALAESTVGRATEKASNRIRSDATRTKRDGAYRDPLAAAAFPKGVDAREAVAAAGRRIADASDQATITGLIDSALDDLERQWSAEIDQAAQAVAEALDTALVDAAPDPALTAAARGDVAARLRGNSRPAWQWLKQRLRGHIDQVLYGDKVPSRGGERDRSIVPAGLIRGALALVGGLPERSAGVNDDGTLTRGTTGAAGPLTGPGTGQVALDRLRVAGAAELGFTWEYPAIARDHFRGHQKLDQVSFSSWTDPQLAVDADDVWLGTHYRPGDHDSCRCWVSRTVIIPMVQGADPQSAEVEGLRAELVGG